MHVTYLVMSGTRHNGPDAVGSRLRDGGNAGARCDRPRSRSGEWPRFLYAAPILPGAGGTMLRSRRLSALFPNRAITSAQLFTMFCVSWASSHRSSHRCLRLKRVSHVMSSAADSQRGASRGSTPQVPRKRLLASPSLALWTAPRVWSGGSPVAEPPVQARAWITLDTYLMSAGKLAPVLPPLKPAAAAGWLVFTC